MARNRFERGWRNGPVYTCAICGRRTRSAGSGNDELCYECWELGGYDNSVNDGGDLADFVAIRDELYRAAVKKGSDGDRIKKNFDFLWPAE